MEFGATEIDWGCPTPINGDGETDRRAAFIQSREIIQRQCGACRFVLCGRGEDV